MDIWQILSARKNAKHCKAERPKKFCRYCYEGPPINEFERLVSAFGTIHRMAHALSLVGGPKEYSTVWRWSVNARRTPPKPIPAKYWPAIIRAAREMGVIEKVLPLVPSGVCVE